MKICPKCQKTYTDANLNFCLDDGTVLNQVADQAMPDTVLLNQTRPTAEPQGFPTTPQQMPQAPQQQGGWNTAQPQYSMQPKKSSKTWVWVLLVIGGLILLCGGGGLAGLIYIGSQAEKSNTNTNTTPNKNSNSGPFSSKTNSSTNDSNSTTTSSSRTSVNKLDLSEWVRPNSLYGNTSYEGSEFMMSSKQKKFYYVLAATDEASNKTEKSDVSVTMRNVDDADSSLGYGLVFHSNPTPLQKGYAFIINTKTQKYHVVYHVPGDEKNVISWTKSDAINKGSAENTIEVRDLDDKIELYINGKMVNSIKNVHGYAGGVVGLYSGDAVKIAFKDLTIKK
ncbi:MAG TPA: hypothetical protein PKA82_16430 [Pyrinomonadaceae bacterium]|nr:hypothetical protein [Pyrinomonadaceae bacterium]